MMTNPTPGRAAQDLEGALSHYAALYWRDGIDDREAWAEVRQQLGAFTAAARSDLLYVPRVWQLWRPSWWSLRFASARAKRRHLRTVKEARASAKGTRRKARRAARGAAGGAAFDQLRMSTIGGVVSQRDPS